MAFTALACVALIYSFILYLWRVDKIRKHRDVKHVFYEKWGPTVLCVWLLVAVLLNFGLRAKQPIPSPNIAEGRGNGGFLLAENEIQQSPML